MSEVRRWPFRRGREETRRFLDRAQDSPKISSSRKWAKTPPKKPALWNREGKNTKAYMLQTYRTGLSPSLLLVYKVGRTGIR